MMEEIALIVGTGSGLSASLAKLFSSKGMLLALAARNVEKLSILAKETGAQCYTCDVTEPNNIQTLFSEVKNDLGIPDIVVYNPSYRARGQLVDLDPIEVYQTLKTNAFGAFLVGQEATRGMLLKGGGNIQFTGATASIKGYPESAPFAMGKFALRGLAQSMARELHPKNIHVAHFIIDGKIYSKKHTLRSDKPDSFLDPDAIARAYLEVTRQHRSAWTWEIELRPWLERF